MILFFPPLGGGRWADTQIRPYTGWGVFRNRRGAAWKRTLPQRSGTEPAPYRRVEADQRRGEVTPPYGCNAGGAKQRADVPRAWPPPTKFRAEIWGVGQVVGSYGKPNQPPKPAGAQRSVRARGREGWAGIGARTIPKGGPPPRSPGQRLAKRKARKEKLVKFSLCPMTSECSTAQKVRKSQQSPARVPVGAA